MSFVFRQGSAMGEALQTPSCREWSLSSVDAPQRTGWLKNRAAPSVYFTLLKMTLQLGWWWSSAGLIEHNQLRSGMLWHCDFNIYCVRTIWRDRLHDLHQTFPSIQQHSQGHQRSTCGSGGSQVLFLLPAPEWLSQKLNQRNIQSFILWIIFYWLLWALKVLLTSMDEGLLTVLVRN